MKRDIADFVAKYPNCQQVKVKHQKLGDNMTPFGVIVDRVTKSAHFLAVKTTYSAENYDKLYIHEIVRVGNVVYELELPAELAVVHPIFHISLLKKCVGDPASIVLLKSVAVNDSLTYEEKTTVFGEPRQGARTVKGTTVRRPARGSYPPRSGGPRDPSPAVNHHMSCGKARGGHTDPTKAHASDHGSYHRPWS
ncbi:hypothetical protein MTR67_003333 [Solanum verrucosum]|uniref:Tf2-1-like SH3-like domain-containing protein n=1 Tax=Solanum verrucosum TaxID=315347 RepID=A0AAF0PS91_SOLVR|nr:hypothetical protein MTR67_003333 [Solanum verrucosum]